MEHAEKARSEEYLALGLASGFIVSVSVNNLQSLVFRNQVAKSKLLMVRELPHLSAYLCFSDDLLLALLRFEQDTVQVFHEFTMFRPVSDLLVLGNHFMAVYPSGDSEVFWIKQEQRGVSTLGQASFKVAEMRIFLIKTEKDQDHDCELTFTVKSEHLGLFLTCGTDGVVKAWSKEKKLQFEF